MKKITALLLALIMVFALVSVGSPTAAAAGKDRLVIRVASDNGTIDYHNSTADNVTRLRSLVCNSLMEAQRDEDGNIQFILGDNSIATDYKMDEDGMGITFTIREGVTFSNGYPMNPSDVAFSIKLYEGLTGFDFIDYANISVDGNELHVPFTQPNASVFYFLGVMIPVYSEQYYNELGGEEALAEFYSTSAIGTGPYKLADWVSGDYIDLEANDDYFGGAPIIKHVRIRMIAEASVALMELETGGVDVVIDPATTDVKDVLAGNYDGEGITYWQNQGTQQYVLGFNCSGILGDKNLREALCYAIDMDAINETVYGVGTTTASSIVSQTAEGIVDLSENWPYPYDPEKAVECRNAAGYGEGEVKLIYLVGGGDAARTAVGEMMANYLAQVGIEMNIVNVDKSAWASMIKDVNGWDVHLRGISAVGTTYLDYFTNLLASTAHFENDPASADMIAAINEIAVTMDSEARLALWQDFQAKYLTDYLYSLPLSQVNDYTLVNDKLVGAEKVSLFRLNLKDAYFAD
ncbi:MAG: ABC transporter substrate-binding protein [Eubacteriales bacterium]|nr:ABC transporter substrate-binding protein [Eubacteriales bacterium]